MHVSKPLSVILLTFLSVPVFAQQQPGLHFIENWDLNEDGVVTVEETRERRGDIFTTFDANEDDVLTAEEYVMFDEAREADMNENGYAVMGGQGQGKGQGKRSGMGEHGAAMAMTRQNADLDGDGRVTRAEFLSGVDLWFPTQDRNGDGVLTQDDFGRR